MSNISASSIAASSIAYRPAII